MFKVWKLDDTTGKQYTVYQVKATNYNIYFLLYRGGQWKWCPSYEYAPVED